ncbi:hypothetical protein EV421DRAFT_1912934 [Armillaria borealis]|uniref:Uncharacterized protein n=1 Tax=Armillaria borealis TaxID=47425 RepID=A0AA39ME24_9AGAR|nr:hypothetical protein EV421DRAFT_1912934 [Armillaria borealis]
MSIHTSTNTMLQDVARVREPIQLVDRFDAPPITECTHRRTCEWGADVQGTTMMPGQEEVIDDSASAPAYAHQRRRRGPLLSDPSRIMRPTPHRRGGWLPVHTLIPFLPALSLYASHSPATTVIDCLYCCRGSTFHSSTTIVGSASAFEQRELSDRMRRSGRRPERQAVPYDHQRHQPSPSIGGMRRLGSCVDVLCIMGRSVADSISRPYREEISPTRLCWSAFRHHAIKAISIYPPRPNVLHPTSLSLYH